MGLGTQIVWLLLLAVPVASVSWTITHEEIFREPREWCERRSEAARSLPQRKFFYVFTCEYCLSHYVTVAALAITRYKLLLVESWWGYVLAFFAVPYVANVYMGLYAKAKLAPTKDRLEIREMERESSERKAA